MYRWTGVNTYVAMCETNSVSFGGGDGHPGLWLDGALFDGSSARCPTFANDILCGAPRPRSLSPPVRQGGNGDVPADLLGAFEALSTGTPGKVKTESFECVGVEAWLIGED